MTTHSTRIKALVFSIAFILCVVIVPFKNVKADSFPSEFYVNSNVYYSASELFFAYIDLNSTQKEICAYILGMYNLMYLGSRGFVFKSNAYTSESEFIAKIKSFGYRFLQGAAEIALKSRMDDDFCKYASACILYSSQCNVADFETWFSNLDQDFTIPVDQGILNSFTLLYNDNDELSISQEGDVITPWDSGELYEYSFENLPWMDVESSTTYYDFIDTNQIYCFTNNRNHFQMLQYCFKPYTTINGSIGTSYHFIDSLYIKRGSSYVNYRWGSSDYNGALGSQNIAISSIVCYRTSNSPYYAIARTDSRAGLTTYFKAGIQQGTANSDLSDFIDECFHQTPFYFSSFNNEFSYFYPYIGHVFLVDDLNTMSNKEEIYNTDSWDLLGIGQNNMIVPIDKVDIKPKVITSITLPSNNGTPVNIQDIINDNNTVDDNGDPVNPWNITIIVQPNETNPISVSVNLFTGAKSYVKYLWESSEKLIQYSATLLNCFEFEDGFGKKYGPKIAILGVVTLGIAGGLIAKFLL